MSPAPVNPAIAALADGKAGGKFVYLKKLGSYVLEVQSTKTVGMRAILEAKVIKAEKTHENEPHRVGEVLSYTEDLSKPANGGGPRFRGMCLAVTGETDAEIDSCTIESVDAKTGQKVIERFSGPGAKALWLGNKLDPVKQPLAFLLVRCDVEPRNVEAKTKEDGTVLPAKTFSSERWSNYELSDAEFAAVEAKRAEAKLPSVLDAMK